MAKTERHATQLAADKSAVLGSTVCPFPPRTCGTGGIAAAVRAFEQTVIITDKLRAFFLGSFVFF